MSDTEAGHGSATLIRLGGLAMILSIIVHVVLNMVLKEFPPEDPTASELQAYLDREADTWAIVHGFRYLAFCGIVLFAAGLFIRTCGGRAAALNGWGFVGLLGTAIWVTSGIVTNGLEILAFVDFDLLSNRPELFWLVFRMTRILFTAEIATWSLVLAGFSAAGLVSATLPKWMAFLGFVGAAGCLLSGVLVISVFTDGFAGMIAELATMASLLWMLVVALYLVKRGAS
ncbi:MAG: hypothetical protein RL885_28305 [Planctomycetota bacterium]